MTIYIHAKDDVDRDSLLPDNTLLLELQAHQLSPPVFEISATNQHTWNGENLNSEALELNTNNMHVHRSEKNKYELEMKSSNCTSVRKKKIMRL